MEVGAGNAWRQSQTPPPASCPPQSPSPGRRPPHGRHLDHMARPVSSPPIPLCPPSSIPPLPALKTKDRASSVCPVHSPPLPAARPCLPQGTQQRLLKARLLLLGAKEKPSPAPSALAGPPPPGSTRPATSGTRPWAACRGPGLSGSKWGPGICLFASSTLDQAAMVLLLSGPGAKAGAAGRGQSMAGDPGRPPPASLSPPWCLVQGFPSAASVWFLGAQGPHRPASGAAGVPV